MYSAAHQACIDKNFDRSHQLLLDARAIRVELHGEHHEEVMMIENMKLAVEEHKLGNYAGAKERYTQSYYLGMRVDGETENAITGAINIASVCWDLDQREQGLEWLKKAREMSEWLKLPAGLDGYKAVVVGQYMQYLSASGRSDGPELSEKVTKRANSIFMYDVMLAEL